MSAKASTSALPAKTNAEPKEETAEERLKRKNWLEMTLQDPFGPKHDCELTT
jgi:hypothetical protein